MRGLKSVWLWTWRSCRSLTLLKLKLLADHLALNQYPSLKKVGWTSKKFWDIHTIVVVSGAAIAVSRFQKDCFFFFIHSMV
ncbi:hypothetical protein Tsubulata_012498 [Turnera subulata]|uniref:Uncharacterized protein n=1 Tax=Turnera subulata TaxID=218843 RepID=A0A9Q0F5V7_9ROSI|nr:hypothetical protein Tsubulata_012498 [Turnera subulata]